MWTHGQGLICSLLRSEKLHNFGQLLSKLEIDQQNISSLISVNDRENLRKVEHSWKSLHTIFNTNWTLPVTSACRWPLLMSYPRLSALAYLGPGWQRVLYLIPACTALLWYIAHLGHIWPSGRKHHLGARDTVLRIYWGYYVVIQLTYWSIIFADITIFDDSFIYLLLCNINWINTMIYSQITHNYVQT